MKQLLLRFLLQALKIFAGGAGLSSCCCHERGRSLVLGFSSAAHLGREPELRGLAGAGGKVQWRWGSGCAAELGPTKRAPQKSHGPPHWGGGSSLCAPAPPAGALWLCGMGCCEWPRSFFFSFLFFSWPILNGFLSLWCHFPGPECKCFSRNTTLPAPSSFFLCMSYSSRFFCVACLRISPN